jgi:hypothetical protein
VKVTIEGADRLASTLASAANDLVAMAATNRAVADALLSSAHPPVLTGRLAASLTPEGTDTEASLSTSLVYAPKQERRHGFLAAALAAQESRVVSMHLGHVNDCLASVRGA